MRRTVSPNDNRSRMQRRKQRRGPRFWTLVGVGALVAAIIIVLLVEAAVSYNKVHAGVSVSGIDLGGLTEDEAVAALSTYVADAQASPIKLTGGGQSWDIMPDDVGTTMDVSAAVAAAMEVTRDSNIFADMVKRWKMYFTTQDLPLTGSVDQGKLDSLMAEIARTLDFAPVNASLAIDGADIQIVEGRNGQVVDQQTLRKDLEGVLVSLHSTEIGIPLTVVEPDVKAEDNQAAFDQARTMVSGPITLVGGENSWTLTTDQIATYLELKPDEASSLPLLVPFLAASRMTAFFEEIAPSVAKDPVDASFDSDGTKAWVIPGQPGEQIDPEATVEALTAAALKITGRTAQVAVMEAEADFTTEEAEAWGVKDLLSSYATTPYYGSSNRQVNVRITTEYAENVFLAPGEEYNFEKVVGPRTPERGYKTAPGIVGEGILEDVYGGGICQVSTTLFNAAFEAGLEILERHNHSLYISHYPDGRDATIAPPGKNLRFRNDTDHYIWIRGVSDGVNTRFNIYGTDDGREVKIKFSGFSYGASRTVETIINPALPPGQSKEIRSGQSARSCSVTRTVTMPDGTILHDGPEVYKSYYPMISKLTQVSPSTTTTTTLPSSTTTTTGENPGTTIVTEF